MGCDTLVKQTNLWRWAKDRATTSNLPFAISPEDIQIPEVCPVLDIPLHVGSGTVSSNSPTLDRVVPDVGYVPGNILVISHKANRLKSNASWLELRLLVSYYEDFITQHWMQQPGETK